MITEDDSLVAGSGAQDGPSEITEATDGASSRLGNETMLISNRVAHEQGAAGVVGNRKFRRAVVPVASIVVEDTFGRELDDAYVATLAAIVDRYEELRHPIVLTSDMRLLSGHRWLAAVNRLGRQQVEVLIAEGAS
jgi:hypothetical protein